MDGDNDDSNQNKTIDGSNNNKQVDGNVLYIYI